MPLSARHALFWTSAICCLLAQVLIVRSVLGVLFFFTWRAIERRPSLEQAAPAPAMEAAR